MITKVKINTRGGTKEYYRMMCAECKKPFYAERSDAQTCSNKCRQKLYRRRQRYGKQQHREKCRQLGLPMPDDGYKAKLQLFEFED